jgi:hypothetical protein
MDYETRIRKELMNDRVFKALMERVKPEERQQVDQAINGIIALAGQAANGVSFNFNNSNITPEELESAISDRTGRK